MIASAVLLLLTAATPVPADNTLDARRADIVASIMTATGANHEAAIAIERSLELFLERLEARLQYFAGDHDFEDKKLLVPETIHDFFVSKRARAQVSSVTLNDTYEMNVDEYLDHLINLRQNQRYVDVHLFFRQWNFDGISGLPDQRGTYEAFVTVWQVFRGSSDTGGYADETRKKIRLRLTMGQNHKANFGIERITVTETTDLRRIAR